MLLAVDAMGGDYGPVEICPGAVEACAKLSDLEVALVGQSDLINKYLGKVDGDVRRRIRVVHADEVIASDDLPAKAIRTKRNSSLRIAMEMVRSKEAQGCVSSGNTGAIVAGGILVVGRIRGIDRPALGILLPTSKPTFLIDAGATVRCKPQNLNQFAMMGTYYMKYVVGVENPSVSLLSNGSEEIKGDEVISAARDLLMGSKFVNFKGFIEANRVPFSEADIVVCDGFSGNVMLKSFEGLIEYGKDMATGLVKGSFLAKMGAALLYPSARKFIRGVDYRSHGGTPLLGVDGAVVKAHGRSKAPAITNAIRAAYNFVDQDALDKIKKAVDTVKVDGNGEVFGLD